ASMLAVAATQFSAQGYELPLRSGFVRHGILAPSMAVAATHAPVGAAAVAASTESATLPRLQLSVAEDGLGVPSIVVYAAAEPNRLQAAGAALAVGPAPAPSQDQAAKSFFEDLLRRGVSRSRRPPNQRPKSCALPRRSPTKPIPTNCGAKDGRWCCAECASTAGAGTVENALLGPIMMRERNSGAKKWLANGAHQGKGAEAGAG